MADEASEQSEINESQDSVFPLPLTPLEKFFFWDDRPEHPYTSFFELKFDSLLDLDVLERSIVQVIERNPLLRSIVAGNDRELRWTLSDKPFRFASFESEPPIVDGAVRSIDLRNEVGVRFWCKTSESCGSVLIQVHHCVCDGIAFRGVLIDILHLYSLATVTEPPSGRDPGMIYDRFRYSLLRERYNFEHLDKPKKSLTTWQRIKNARYFHFQPPTPLLSPKQQSKSCTADAGANNPLCHMVIDRELSTRIFNKCQAESIGVNELSIALLFRACKAWNQLHGDHRKNARLRILMPYDLRGRIDLRMPATNRLSLTFLGRGYEQCDDFAALLNGVKNELQEMKDTHLYLDLLNGFALGAKLPRFMKWGVNRSHSMATAVVTYAGDVSRGMGKLFPEVDGSRRVGSARLSSIMAAPPFRRNTNVSLAICINWGQINISAAWNRAALTAKDCEAFLELYRTGWQQWCEVKA